MKLTIRFTLFFFLGLFIFVIGMGLFISLMLEYIFPLIGKEVWADGSTKELIVVVIPFIIAGILFSLYFVKPLVQMLTIIAQLSSGNYDLGELEMKVYTKKGELKFRYRLYKEALNDLHGLANNLLQNQKEQVALEKAKHDWISGVSHDLKTPLSYITGYSALLKDKEHMVTPEEKIKYSEEIYDKSIYINELLEDINFSFKMDALGNAVPLQCKQFELVDFLQRLIADMANDPRAAMYDLGFHNLQDSITINADPKLLYRAISNIIVNAIIHNPLGTEISVKVESKETHVVIEVADNGKGISKVVLEHIFERYYRKGLDSDTNFSGGFGLAIVKNIIEAHNGQIECDSIVGAGSTFTLLIPIIC